MSDGFGVPILEVTVHDAGDIAVGSEGEQQKQGDLVQHSGEGTARIHP